MPTTFRVKNPDTGEREAVEFLSLAEVAAELHVSESYVRAMTDDRHGAARWKSLELARRRWMSWDMVDDALERQTTEPGSGIPEAETPPKLGTPVDDVDLEPIRRPVPEPEDSTP